MLSEEVDLQCLFENRQWFSCLDSKGKFTPPPGAKTEKSLDAYLPCTLRDSGSGQVVLEARWDCGAEWGLIEYCTN